MVSFISGLFYNLDIYSYKIRRIYSMLRMIHISYFLIIVPLHGGIPCVAPPVQSRLHTDGNFTYGAQPLRGTIRPFGQITNLTNGIQISYLLQININNL